MIDELQRDTFAPKSLSDIEKYFIRRKQLELEKEKQLLAQRAYDKIDWFTGIYFHVALVTSPLTEIIRLPSC